MSDNNTCGCRSGCGCNSAMADGTTGTEPTSMVIVSGFLGAGKTTLLRRVAERCGKGTALVVNEFASADVDSAMLSENAPQGVVVEPIPGGSIFCRCLAHRFAQTITELATREDVNRIVVEATGVADPSGADTLVSEFSLQSKLRVDRVVTVVDPGTVRKVVQTMEAARRQIEVADVIVINKCDVRTAQDIADALALIAELNPAAMLCKATNCDVPLEELLFGGRRNEALGELTPCRDESVCRVAAGLPIDACKDCIVSTLESADSLWTRAKGFVRAGEDTFVIDASESGVDVRPFTGTTKEPPRLVLLGPSENEAQLQTLVNAMASVATCAAPQTTNQAITRTQLAEA